MANSGRISWLKWLLLLLELSVGESPHLVSASVLTEAQFIFSSPPGAMLSSSIRDKLGENWLKPWPISLQVPGESLLLLFHALGGQGDLPACMQWQTSADQRE